MDHCYNVALHCTVALHCDLGNGIAFYGPGSGMAAIGQHFALSDIAKSVVLHCFAQIIIAMLHCFERYYYYLC